MGQQQKEEAPRLALFVVLRYSGHQIQDHISYHCLYLRFICCTKINYKATISTQIANHGSARIGYEVLRQWRFMKSKLNVCLQPGDMAEDEADIDVVVAKKSPASSPLKTLKLVLGNETVSTIKLQQD